MPQEKDETTYRYRWYVHTDKGRKVTWAASAAEAKARMERQGLKVSGVDAAGSLKQRIEEGCDNEVKTGDDSRR